MTPERYQKIGQLFDEALKLLPEDRAAFLEQASGADYELRVEVEKLLDNHSSGEGFLSRPAVDVAAELLALNQAPLAAGKQISHYQIISMLGAGGMGEVYLAEDKRLKRKVALKVLPEMIAKDERRLRRFEQEAFAASALNHPNILTVYEFGAEGDTHFLATELVEGETVRARLKREGLPIEKALDVAAQTAQALAAAHAAGIIHRDIKPENVMIRKDGIVKVLDFGLAKLVEQAPREDQSATWIQGITQPGSILGTVAYMSPEQARGERVDARTDIFSLGVILYEMLTRHHPFMGETISHTMVSILDKEPPPLSNRVNGLPRELEDIERKSLAKKAENRYQSASAMLADLRQLQKRLEFSEFARVSQIQQANETPTQIIQSRELAGLVSNQLEDRGQIDGGSRTQIGQSREPIKDAPSITGPEASTQIAQSETLDGVPTQIIQSRVTESQASAATQFSRPNQSSRLWLLAGLVLLAGLAIQVWFWTRSKSPAVPTDITVAAMPERNLNYSLTVQRFRDGKPYQSEFRSTGQEIFESGWKFKINMTSQQEGFLYLLNRESDGNYRLLFPLPSHNNGSAYVGSNEGFQTSWYVVDANPGIEKFRLIWAKESVPELEKFRELVNPTTKGLISDPADVQVVNAFLSHHGASQSEVDKEKAETSVRGRGSVLVALVELEHR